MLPHSARDLKQEALSIEAKNPAEMCPPGFMYSI